jgi:hypothetical protein
MTLLRERSSRAALMGLLLTVVVVLERVPVSVLDVVLPETLGGPCAGLAETGAPPQAMPGARRTVHRGRLLSAAGSPPTCLRYRPAVREERARPPSRTVRQIARFGLPISVVATVLALVGVVALVLNLLAGAGAWSIVSSVAMVAFWAPVAYGVGVELRRNVRGWDAALDARRVEGD